MNIYSANETNFERNGYGFLKDCLSATVTESLNGDYVLDITYPINAKLCEYLIEDNIIKCNVGNDNFQLFRIKKVVKDFQLIQVYAYHIFYDLLNNMLLDVAPTNQNCQTFGQWILDRTDFSNEFVFSSNIGTVKSARYVRRNPVDAILGDSDNSMVNLFGGEIERDNFTIKFNTRRGNDNHVKLMFGKNIKSINITTDISELYTRVLPLGYDGLTIPENYVDSPIINDYPTPRITKVEFSNIKYDPESEEEGTYTVLADAEQALRDATNELFEKGIDKPTITIKIDWLELSKIEQYKYQYQALETVRLGDTITANILGLDYTTRVTKTKYNVLSDMVEQFEIGSVAKSIINTLNQQAKAISEISPASIVEQAKDSVSGLITSAMGGYVYKTNEELYIMDTDDITTAQKVWRWNINGLGYSSTGVNGTYETAMTMDGQIVADMITTGKINTNLIEGYDALTQKVGNAVTNTTLTQTMNDWIFNSNQLVQVQNQIDENENGYTTQTELNQYIRFKDGNIILGTNTSDTIAVLTNEGLFFCPANTENDFKTSAIAYFANDTLVITNSINLKTVRIGSYQFTPRTNKSLSFGKVD